LLGEVKPIEEEERILFEKREYGIAHTTSQLHRYDMFVFRPFKRCYLEQQKYMKRR